MRFEMWSIWHFVLMIAPVVAMLALWFILKNKSQKTKYVVGVVIGVISLLILITRNVDIFIQQGFSPELIPLQVCHFGNIMVFVSLVFKSKTATSLLWILNLFAAFASLVFADSLVNYTNIWSIRAQAYIWGHIFIVLGALYAVLLKIVRIDFKSFLYSLGLCILFLIPSIILNAYFNNVMGMSINYFYVYNSDGVPFEFIYNLGTVAKYGWFTINWVYTLSIIGIFVLLMYGIYNLQKLLYLKDKSYETHHIFHKKQEKILNI